MKNLILILSLLCYQFLSYSNSSLVLSDPQNTTYTISGYIENVELRLTPKGANMLYELTMTIMPDTSMVQHINDTLEANLTFDLPANSLINDSWLWIDDYVSKGKLIEKDKAISVYENIVRKRRRDPSILTKFANSNRYALRIYPVMVNMPRKVKISYLVPMTWYKDHITVPLPIEIFKTSYPSPKISLAIKVDTFLSGYLLEQPNSIPSIDSSVNGYNYYTVLSTQYTSRSILSVKATKTDTACVTSIYYTGVNEGYFESKIDLRKVVQVKTHKICLVIENFNGSNQLFTTSIDYVNYLKKILLQNYSNKDSFMLVYSSGADTTSYISVNHWIPFTDSNMDLYFDNLLAVYVMNSHFATAQILGTANELIKTNNSGGEILFFSNTGNAFVRGSGLHLNDYFADVKTRIDSNISINILNYFKGKYTNELLNSNYALDTLISCYTHGKYNDLRYISHGSYDYTLIGDISPDELFQKQLDDMSNKITTYNFYISLPGGIIEDLYESYNTSTLKENSVVRISGRFYGSNSIATTLCFITDTMFSIYTFSPYYLSADSSIKQAHIANKYLIPSDNNLSLMPVSDIIDLSIENKVLCTKTAFLALERTDTVQLCVDCVTDAGGGGSFSVGNTEENKTLIKVYPNPFNKRINIISPQSINKIEIYEMLGNLILAKYLEDAQYEFSFDIPSNSNIQSGIYILKLISAEGILEMKIYKH